MTGEIAIANEQVSIIKACNMIGMDIPDFSLSSLKVYCPFGHLYHADEGRSRAMRIYPATNSAYCFAGCGYLSPVKLIAIDRDSSEQDAAEWLLEQIGWVPPDYVSQWEALTQTEFPQVNTVDLGEALKTFCARSFPDHWTEFQFYESVAVKLSKCLSLLRKVHTPDDAEKWMRVAKQVMHQELTHCVSQPAYLRGVE